jgi:hypothetical protein
MPCQASELKESTVNFYQVNQYKTFKLEFGGGYLCCPDGPFGGWQLMRQLQVGDILFHYNSRNREVLGISKVIEIGKHKGSWAAAARVIPGTPCIRYVGRHMSESAFSKKRALEMRKRWADYLEVHAAPKKQGNFGKLLSEVPQRYLIELETGMGYDFLAKHGISFAALR